MPGAGDAERSHGSAGSADSGCLTASSTVHHRLLHRPPPPPPPPPGRAPDTPELQGGTTAPGAGRQAVVGGSGGVTALAGLVTSVLFRDEEEELTPKTESHRHCTVSWGAGRQMPTQPDHRLREFFMTGRRGKRVIEL